jgi:CDP-diacylglycerol---serine O-phosphatidyltransferase
MKITRAVVPSLFTILNIFCGFLSIIETSNGHFVQASWFIVGAALFDTLDGLMARITKSTSDFGVELDSLCDVVSFGVAPSYLVYMIHLKAFEGPGVLISAMPMMLGAIRLARFNVQLVGHDKDYFKGLPIPAQAITLCAFILRYYNDATGLPRLQAGLLAPMVIILSLLMVSTIKYDTAPKFSRRGIAQHPWRFTFGIVAITAILVTKGDALFPIFVGYLATGPIRSLVEFIRGISSHQEKENGQKDAEVSSIDV